MVCTQTAGRRSKMRLSLARAHSRFPFHDDVIAFCLSLLSCCCCTADQEKLPAMPSLLSLMFMKARRKEEALQEKGKGERKKKSSASGYGKEGAAAEREEGGKGLAYAAPFDPIPEDSGEHDVDEGRHLVEDAFAAVSNKKKTSSSSRSKGGKGHPPPPLHSPVTRRNFSAVKNVAQGEPFTNNESLPSMEKAYREFKRLYPEYLDTHMVDDIRAREYSYLDESGHVCLDYSGYGLFSKWQESQQKVSASFGLSYISVNLPTHALYGGADEGTVEHDIKRMVLDFLNIQESEYAVVFTASRGSAFKLLGESYPFHLNKKLLSVYDYESDAMIRLEEAAQNKGAEIMSACFRWPSQRLWATDLKKKLLEKKKSKREPGKGLFVFPVQSRVTGAKYSYQWMSQAQENGWDILLDASALGPNAMVSLGLCVFRPDFIVSSFFKVYGLDPTGFGCLLIKRSAIPRLHTSSAARGVGLVRLVPTSVLPEKQLKGGDIREVTTVVADSARFTERKMGSLSSTLMGPPRKVCMPDDRPPLTSEILVASSGKQGRGGPSPPSPSSCDSLYPKLLEVGGRGASNSSSKMLADEPPTCSTATQPWQKRSNSTNIVSLQATEQGSGHDCCWRFNGGDEDEISSKESSASMGCDSSRANEGGFLHHRQPHVSSSTTIMDGQQDDVSGAYSEDISSPFFFDDDDYEDVSAPFRAGEDDDNGKSFFVTRKEPQMECRGLHHAHQLGLIGTNIRLRCLINWLIASMLKLYHPGSPNSHRLVQIYGPKVDYDRGASVAFNLTDWKGNILQPLLVQRLADRSNISFGVTTLNHIHVPKSSARWPSYVEHLNSSGISRGHADGEARVGGKSPSFDVITVTICFLSNFEDVYRFWRFLSNFLDADFVSKEVWRYRSLNQKAVILGVTEPRNS